MSNCNRALNRPVNASDVKDLFNQSINIYYQFWPLKPYPRSKFILDPVPWIKPVQFKY